MKDAFSFRDTAVAGDGSLLLLSSVRELDDEGTSHTVASIRSPGDTSFRKLAGVAWQSDLPAFVGGEAAAPVLIGEDGEVLVPGRGRSAHSLLEQGDDTRIVSGIFEHAGGVVVCGFGGLVYQSADARKWQRVDRAIPDTIDFYAVAANTRSEILAVGREGSAWLFDGVSWSELDCPSSNDLTAVAPTPQGWLVCGRGGVAFRAIEGRFESLLDTQVSLDLWGVAGTSDQIFVSSTVAVFEVVRGEAVPIEGDFDSGYSCCRLRACADVVVSTGEQDVLLYQGGVWTRVL